MTLSLTACVTLDKSYWTFCTSVSSFLGEVIKLEARQASFYVFYPHVVHRPGREQAIECKSTINSGSKERII